MTDERAGAVPVKDLVVLIPLFATSLAISWEVGRFVPYGGFLFFSLSEHLLAAMEALPYALFLSTLFVAPIIMGIKYSPEKKPSERGRNPFFRGRTIAKLVVAVILIAGVSYYYFYLEPGFTKVDAFALCGVILTFAVVAANRFWLRRPWSDPVTLSLLGAAAIILAMMSGVTQSLATLDTIKRGAASRYIATIVSKNDASKGFVLMMGERGLLIYFPDGDRFSFQKADEIQKIEWQR